METTQLGSARHKFHSYHTMGVTVITLLLITANSWKANFDPLARVRALDA